LPHISAKIYLTAPSQRRTWLEVAEFAADIYIDIYFSPPGWVEKSRIQTEFVHAQSAPTGRAKYMFATQDASSGEYSTNMSLHV
jgi:hypothetical protein